MSGIVVTPSTSRTPWARRGAQLLLVVPLGGFQLVASIVFTFTDGVKTPWQALVVAWAWSMSVACIAIGTRLGRGTRLHRLAAAALAAQLAFCAIKLTVYHESASFVFGGIVLAAAALLALSRPRPRPLRGLGNAVMRELDAGSTP